MRPLYEIDADLEDLLNIIDEETGEVVIDEDALNALRMERDQKIEGVALSIKNLAAEIAMVKAEVKNLTDRAKSLERTKQGREGWLDTALGGMEFSTSKVVIKQKKSKSVEIDDAVFWENPDPRYLRIKQPEPEADKVAIAAALKNGQEIPGAKMVEKLNMNIK